MMNEPEVSLMVMSDVEASFTLQGKEYLVRRLELADYAKGQQHIHDRRMNNILKVCMGQPMSDECVAMTLANVEKQTITIEDVWNDLDGETFLLFLALQCGEQKYTLPQVRALRLPRVATVAIMLWACGIPEKHKDKAPLAESATDSAS